MTLRFGVYPGGLSGLLDGGVTPGPAEQPDRIRAALDDLHGDLPFLVRGYLHHRDAAPGVVQAPPEPEQYAGGPRRLDLVLCFREPGTDLTGWLAFIREQLHRLGPVLAKVQIAEEPSNPGPGGDGALPAVRQAVVEGVVAARREADRLGLDVQVGCNATPTFDPAQEFWTDLGRRGGARFAGALDYVGLDFFPDVFRPVPAAELGETVAGVLAHFRERCLPAAGIAGSVPIHVTEHGWPTGPDRSPARQAEVLETVVRAVAERAEPLHITTYEHFSLRDADSSQPDPMCRFGLLDSDYRPKPAFDLYRKLIAELSQPVA